MEDLSGFWWETKGFVGVSSIRASAKSCENIKVSELSPRRALAKSNENL